MAAIFQTTFLNTFSGMKNISMSIKIPLKFVFKGQVNIIPSLVQIKAYRPLGDKPLSESMMVRSPTHVCVARRQ